MPERLRISLERLLLAAAVLAAWQLSSGTIVAERIISSPVAVGAVLGEWLPTWEFWNHVRVTLSEAVAGYVIGAAAGVVAGVILGLNRFLADVVEPAITAVYSIPKVSFAPLLILLFGIGPMSKVALTVLIVFFFVFFDTFHGVRSVDPTMREPILVMGASRWQVFRYVTWPSTKEWVIEGLKLSVPMAFVGAVSGEILVSNEGLGFLVRQASRVLDVAGILAALAALAALATVVNMLVTRVRSRATRWRGEVRAI
jgi:NitT/TauT family transport system permease protein